MLEELNENGGKQKLLILIIEGINR